MITLKATSYEVSGTELKINVSPICTCKGTITQLCNGEDFKLITCLPFPSVTTLVPVILVLNDVEYPMLTLNGNTLMSDQIRCRQCYRIQFGTYPTHFIVKQCLRPSQAAPTSVSATAPPAAPAAPVATVTPSNPGGER